MEGPGRDAGRLPGPAGALRATPPPALPGGTNWLFWQFTENATVQGVPAKVGENVFAGDCR